MRPSICKPTPCFQKAFKAHYSVANRHSLCVWEATGSVLPANRSGRGPPGRRSRLELQALSNSLQLTSN